MSHSIQDHWNEVKDVRAELEAELGQFGTVYLMSQKRKKQGITAGQVSVASVHVAALMLSQETHRRATDEEVAQWQDAQAQAAKAMNASRAKEQSKVNLDLGGVIEALGKVINDSKQQAPAPAPVEVAPAPAQTVDKPSQRSQPAKTASPETFD